MKMKRIPLRKTICYVLAVTTFLFALQSTSAVRALEMKIITPSANQSQIAPGRDFYIFGSFDQKVPDGCQLQIDLFPKGGQTPIRQVIATSMNNKQGLYIDYSGLSYYGSDRSELRESMMPDLVYDPSTPSTFSQVWRKCYFSDRSFTAVLSGGTYQKDLSLVSQNGEKLSPLPKGDYLIRATLLRNQQKIAETSKDLKIGYYSDKILSRFSPQEHFQNIQQFASQKGIQVFLDLFPGYWSPSDSIPELAGKNLFAEILPRWRLADAQEYDEGRTHLVLYNISPTSATYAVEIGRLTYLQNITDPQRVIRYYYDIGEPTLEGGKKQGRIVQMAANDSLQLTRAEFSQGEKDNEVRAEALQQQQSDYNLADGILVPEGKHLVLNGVVAPLSNEGYMVTHNDDETYTIPNRVENIRYRFSVNGKEEVYTKAVGLVRVQGQRKNLSVVEFRHSFATPTQWKGKRVRVRVEPLDHQGHVVLAGSEDLQVTFQ